MRWHILPVGKPKLEFAKLGASDYLSRLKPFAQTEAHWIKVSNSQDEGTALLDRSKAMFRVVLDERGEHVTSAGLAKKISKWELEGPRDFALLIGGADGHTDEVRQAAGWVWSLSKLTLQHELALVIALEQIYRAYTIKSGLPYHRE